MKTFTERQTELKLNKLGVFTTKAGIRFPKSGDTVPAGATVELHVSEQRPDRMYFRYANDNPKTVQFQAAHKYFKGFGAPPTLRRLEKMGHDGVVTTPTGHRTEPDGYGPDGSPSWMLVLGLI